MNEYRVISAKRFLPFIIGPEQNGHIKLEFFPQSRNEFTIELSKKERWQGDVFQHDEDGWMFFSNRLSFDDLKSAYAYIEKQKEVTEYDRQIHPYPPVEFETEEKYIKLVDEKHKNIIYYIKEIFYNSPEYTQMFSCGRYVPVGDTIVDYKLSCWADVVIDTDKNQVLKCRNGFENIFDKQFDLV